MNENLMKLAIAGGILFAAYKWGPGPVKAGALALAAVAIGKRTPYLNEVI
jgi:hypothetical protein